MRPKIAALEEEARAVGEAFLAVRASGSLRIGVAARWADDVLSLDLEVQIRLLPSRPDVDVASLRARADELAALEAAGFGLAHFEDGWVMATRPVLPHEVDEAVASVSRLLAEEVRYPGRT